MQKNTAKTGIDMLKRLNEIQKMEKADKNHILYAIDGLIKSVKLKNIAAL